MAVFTDLSLILGQGNVPNTPVAAVTAAATPTGTPATTANTNLATPGAISTGNTTTPNSLTTTTTAASFSPAIPLAATGSPAPARMLYLLPDLPDAAWLAAEDINDSPPEDWSDSFIRPFHLDLENDPVKLASLATSFSMVRDPDSFSIWCSKIKHNAVAFLGVDRHGGMMIFHNPTLDPESGTLVNPTPQFYVISGASFGTPASGLDSTDLPKLFTPFMVDNVPPYFKIAWIPSS